MNIETFIGNWIAISNTFDTEKYLDFYLPDAVLYDPSVGETFENHKGIKEYFERYFIDYHTYIKQIDLKVIDEDNAYLEVIFTGDFPERKIGGTFEFKFKDKKISFIKADLSN